MAPNVLPQSETKLRTIVSNTGCTSVGELEIIPKISAVAVCCSSASASLFFRSALFRSALAARREISLPRPVTICVQSSPSVLASRSSSRVRDLRFETRSGDPAISVDPSRNVHPEHPQDEPGRKHVQLVQSRRSGSPYYGVEDSENDPVSRKCPHFQSAFPVRPVETNGREPCHYGISVRGAA
jgi:hypothetical protein